MYWLQGHTRLVVYFSECLKFVKLCFISNWWSGDWNLVCSLSSATATKRLSKKLLWNGQCNNHSRLVQWPSKETGETKNLLCEETTNFYPPASKILKETPKRFYFQVEKRLESRSFSNIQLTEVLTLFQAVEPTTSAPTMTRCSTTTPPSSPTPRRLPS